MSATCVPNVGYLHAELLDNQQLADSSWPDTVIMVQMDEVRSQYLATNCTTPPPDPMTVSMLMVFDNMEQAAIGQEFFGAKGTCVQKTLEEARELAKSKKPVIQGLVLVVDAHFVRLLFTD